MYWRVGQEVDTRQICRKYWMSTANKKVVLDSCLRCVIRGCTKCVHWGWRGVHWVCYLDGCATEQIGYGLVTLCTYLHMYGVQLVT
jgi:hypothetical protein